MTEEGGPLPPGGSASGGGPQNWLKLSSFDATSFFAQQQQEQERQRSVQGQQLQAAADLLLPSSSEGESSSSGESSGGEEKGAGIAAAERQRRRCSPSVDPSTEEGCGKKGVKKRKREERRRRDGKGKKRQRREKERRGKEQGRHPESEREQQVRLERQTGAAQRASQVKAWASSTTLSGKDAYYFDTRGDPANLAFGGLYRMDVALYRRFDPARFAASLGTQRHGQQNGIRQLPTEADGHMQRDRSNRYFGPGSLRAERNARLKRWRRALQQPQLEGGSEAAVPGLLGWRRPPGGKAPQPERRRIDLPSLSFLPLRVKDAEQPRQQQHNHPHALQQQQAALSAAEELTAEKAERAWHEGETNEELLLRRTKDFNVATRERPHDIKLWLEFARFQDEALRLGPPHRGGERGTAEKKIAILEKALCLHPGSDELLLALLQSAELVCDDVELERRWRAVLARHAGSPRLWHGYLHYRRMRFSGFSAVEVATAYDDAFAALHSEHRRRAAQGATASVLAPLEADAVAVAVESVQLRLAAGATEHAVAAVQVLLEFNFLSPEGWPEDALEAMFEECWRSGAPLVGQPGAAGWAAWIAGEPTSGVTAASVEARTKRQRQRKAEEQEQQQQQVQAEGGEKQDAEWGGWEELAPAIRARFGHSLWMGAGEPGSGGKGAEGQPWDAAAAAAAAEAAAVAENVGEGLEEEDGEEELPEEETDEQLLERLGMNLEAALEETATTLTPPLLEAWLAMERQRQAAQWQPRRAEAAKAQDSGKEEAEEEPADHRTVGWQDVRRLLWRFESEAARQQLLVGCLRLLGAPLPGAQPSNSPAATAAAYGADELWQAAAAAGCHPDRPASVGGSTASGGWVAELLMQGDWGWLLGCASSSSGAEPPPGLRQQPWYQADPSCREMLRRLLAALVRGPGRQDGCLVQALLSVASEGLAAAPAQRPSFDFSKARELAKQLLAEQRTNLTLWQAYAQLEVAAGSTKAARKVYQACFATASTPGSLADAAAAAPLVLGAVQLELQLSGIEASAAALPSPALAAPSYGGSSLLHAMLGPAADGAAAMAARHLAWLGSGGAVALLAAPNAGDPAPLSQEEIVAAKRGFQDCLLVLIRQQQQATFSSSSQLTPGARALVVAAVAFEQVIGQLRGDVSAGVKAALAIYDQVLTALMPQQQEQQQQQPPCDAQLELLHWQRCQLAADAARHALPCAPPRAVRDALLRALRLYPASPALLQLLVAHEASGHTFTQLRRELYAILEKRPSPQGWLAMLAVEVTTHSPEAVVQATLERAVASEAGRACPLLWRCYLRFEACRGRPEVVRRVFLRAIGACPWSKAVWCDSLTLLNGHAPPKELSEYVEVMKDKELVLRTDVFEVVLAQLEGSGGGGGGGDGTVAKDAAGL